MADPAELVGCLSGNADASMKYPRAFLRVAAFMFTLLFAAAASPRAAMADSIATFVQITCAPELNYFSIRRFKVPSPGFSFMERLRQSQRTTLNPHGIYTRSALEETPVECHLVAGTPDGRQQPLQIRTVGFFKNSNVDTDSDRFINDYVDVLANGKKLGELSLNPLDFTEGYDLLEMFVDGTAVNVRKCAAAPTLCSTERWH
jgi:hypothetical protein